jgi:hypothetical protein
VPILDLQKRLQEAGRIRIGQQVLTRNNKKRPAALDTFRLTSRDRTRIEAAAKLYGGKVEAWDNDGRKEWEVITQSDKLPVVVPPAAMSFSQFYEVWSAAGCQRRCDGAMEKISEQPCVCDPDSRECEPHTRLSLFLRDVPGLGLWRLDTSGYWAAVELQGAVDIISVAAGKGQMLPATLRLDQRESKRVDEVTHKFVVPVLDIEVTPAQLLMGTISVDAPQQSALTPVPVNGEPASIADQVKAADSIESRRKRAAPIPETGVQPRTAAQAAQAAKDSLPANSGVTVGVGALDAEVHRAIEDDVQHDPQINGQQLAIIGHVFSAIGTPNGDQIRLDWCIKTLNTQLSSPRELTENDAIILISKLTMLHRIREHYKTEDYNLILEDLTEYLQRDTKLEHIDQLSDDDITAIIEAIDMTEKTGNRILGLNINDPLEGDDNETTVETETQ